MQLHEPATLVTDYLLAVIAGGLAWRLRRTTPPHQRAARNWQSALTRTAISSFLGGTSHGFGPELPALVAQSLWVGTLVTICFAAAAIDAALGHELAPQRRRVWRHVVVAKFALFAMAAVLSPRFVVVILGYGASLLAWVIAGLGVNRPWRAWMLGAIGLSFIAAAVQQLRLAPSVSFNHNDLYHLLQAFALIGFYQAARRITVAPRRPRISAGPMRIAAALLAAALVVAPLRAAEPAFDAFLESVAADFMLANPNAATTQQYFSGAEQDALDRQLTPITKAARTARVERAKRALERLKTYDRSQLKSTQRVSAAMMEWQLDDIVTAAAFEDYDFPFQQFRGRQVELVNFLSQTHPIRNRRDIENYLVRLDQAAGHIDDALALAQEIEAKNIRPPKFILNATIDQIGRFLSDPPAKNVLVASLDERAAKVKELSADDRAKFVAAAEKTVASAIIPAFHRAQEFLKSQLPRATDDAGLWRLPDGERAYAAGLRRFTTMSLTADQIHALGLKEVARIEGEMDVLLRELGYKDGSVKARYEKMDADLQPKEADPRPALLARYTEIVRDAEKRAALLFDLRPQAPCAVRREPPFTEQNAAAHYSGPARDGTRPGVFWVPLPKAPWPMARMRTLAYHEAVPGHHFQVALQSESKELPGFRRDRVFGGISAHGEGWALYAERLATESGWYDGDKIGRIGQLNSELFRARRLVVDTGLHAKKWTRQQAIDYGIQASEVERYVVTPGQACAYKIGELKILELREKAKRALGAKFSLKEFHNAVLRAGNVPLDVLALVVDDYIASKR